MKTLDLKKNELGQIADLLRSMLPEGGVIVLQGNLAAGKTTLVQAVASAFGVESPVTSPTFSLQQCYGDTLYHYDIYSKGIEHFLALGLLEELEKPGYHFIEWGEETLVKLLETARIPTVIIKIDKCADTKVRHYEVTHAQA